MKTIEVGQIVRAKYKTGQYLGEVISNEETRTLVKILAVLKHPIQGDLHAPKQTDVALFHRRKALAQFEKAWMPISTVSKYEEEVPPYSESLLHAVNDLEAKLQEDNSPFAQQSLQCLNELKDDYQLS
jgi:kinase-associated protein B